jgi:acyl-CoA synthetase (AMP-forming)/AMP-acid ligase II/CBS domain-containing protein
MAPRSVPQALTVADIMTSHVLTVGPSASIADAAILMRDRRVGSALVVDGSRLIGILTERDLVRFAASGTPAATITVDAYMTADPDTTTPTEEAIDVLRRFVERGYRHVPVVSKGKVVGIVSMRDLFLKLQRGATTIHPEVSLPPSAATSGEPTNRTLVNLLEVGHAGDSALVVPDGPRISYATLRTYVRQVADMLASLGVQRGQRVAVVTSQTPVAIATVLGTSFATTVAPMNPGLTEDEIRFYFEDVSARVLIVPAHGADAARAAWGAQGPIVEASLTPRGELRLETRAARQTRVTTTHPGPDDVALILHSSGTTGRPKRAPLRHRNLVASADNIVRTYALNASDVALCVMPLFHVHGLVASVLATLASGGTIAIPSRFNPLGFRRLLEAQRATWYTAVPSIHQMVLARSRDAELAQGDRVLRFIRSASAKLRQDTLLQLEERFGVPMLEAYGMTEGSHQIASNPLPPAPREAGSVGRSVGLRVGVMDEHGALLTIGASGEVVIQGPNVIDGYDENPAADAAAFTNGWFRTGDLGVLDAAAYLTLVGRLKEMINRGGEKIAPLEIDEVLLQHPSVAEAVSFGVPHVVWGEEVQAVVVLRGEVTERELIRHCQLHLAEFKLPKRVHFAEAIPRTATGKVQRVRMPGLLGIK